MDNVIAWISGNCRFANATLEELPPEPGTTPIPPGMIRGYHYTYDLDAVLRRGLDIQHAKGNTYNEPNMIWLSAQKPGDHKEYVEVAVKPEEIDIGRPWTSGRTPEETEKELARFNGGASDFTLAINHVPPDRIVTYHRPWHDQARYIMNEWPPNDPQKVAEGKESIGYILTDPSFNGTKERTAVEWWFQKAGLDQKDVVDAAPQTNVIAWMARRCKFSARSLKDILDERGSLYVVRQMGKSVLVNGIHADAELADLMGVKVGDLVFEVVKGTDGRKMG